jgi:hypothetical protein
MTTAHRTLAAVVLACSATLLALPSTAGAVAHTPVPAAGYWLAASDGGVFAFDAPFFGSGVAPSLACSFTPQPPSTADAAHGCDGIAASATGSGYWLVNVVRLASGFGQVPSPPQSVTDPVTVACTSLNGGAGQWAGAASSATGGGFFLAASNGGVLGCGDALPVGGLADETLAAPVVGIASTPDGDGYWMVGADGGVFAFGDAPFEGSMGGVHLAAPVVGIAPTADGGGYWLVASDGGVFAFGDARFQGSMGGRPLDAPVVGIASAGASGYWLAAADGGVFAFGDAPFEGSMVGRPLNAPVTGIAPFTPAPAG